MNYFRYSWLVFILFITGYVCAESAELINYPDIYDITLENGLRVMLIEYHEQPTVSYRLLVNAGEINEPLKKEGLSEITARLLIEGTLSMTSNEIADTIAAIGGRFNISSKAHYTILGFDVLSQYSEIGFNIFTDIILNPGFPLHEFKRIKNEFVNYVRMELTSNYKIASNHSEYLLFGSEHPLGRPKTEKSIREISQEDTKAFYKRNFLPNNSILLVIGDFSKKEELSRITEKFRSWEVMKISQAIHTIPDFSKKGRLRVVDKPDMTQAVIHLNQWAVSSRHPDYYGYILANYLLGGGDFSSRLMSAVRAEGGKTYSIYSRCNINLDYGILTITTSTRNNEIFKTYQLIQEELHKFVDKGVTEEELTKAKSYMTGAIPLQLESPVSIANKILNGVVKGRTIDDLQKQVIKFNSVGLADVNRVISEYIKPENMNIVIVGDFKKVKGQLEEIGSFERVYYKDPLVKEPFFFLF